MIVYESEEDSYEMEKIYDKDDYGSGGQRPVASRRFLPVGTGRALRPADDSYANERY